jgi:MFS family permease
VKALLRRPDFRRLFVGVLATMLGDSALLLVLAIWVKQLTGSNSLAGLTLFTLSAPGLFAPVLGWIVDRFRRKPFLVVSVFLTAVALVPLTFVRDRSDIGLIYVVGVLYGASLILISGALNGLIKAMLPEDLLAPANGALQTVRQGLRLVGPLGGAALFTVFGGPALAVFSMACLVVGALAIASVRAQEERPAPPELHWVGEAVAGVRHLFGPAALRRATIGLILTVTVIGFTETLIFAYADQGLHRGPAFVSVIVCVQGIGGLAGGLCAAAVIRRLGELGTIALGVVGFGVAFGGLAYPNMVLGFVCVVIAGLSIPLALVAFNTLMQRVTEGRLMGRVSTAAEAAIGVPQALSVALGAGLAAFVDYRILYLFMALVQFGAAAYLWVARALSAPVDVATAPAPVLEAGLVQPGEVVHDLDEGRVDQH